MLPYLEAFFNYGTDDSGMNTLDRGAIASKYDTVQSEIILLDKNCSKVTSPVLKSVYGQGWKQTPFIPSKLLSVPK